MRRTSQRRGKQAVGCDGALLELPKIGTHEKPAPPSESSFLAPDKNGSAAYIEEPNDLHVVDVDAEVDDAQHLDSVLENKEVTFAFPLPKPPKPMTPQKRSCKEEDDLFSLDVMSPNKKVVGPLCKSHPSPAVPATTITVMPDSVPSATYLKRATSSLTVFVLPNSPPNGEISRLSRRSEKISPHTEE